MDYKRWVCHFNAMAHIEIMGKEADGMQCSSVYCEEGGFPNKNNIFV